MNDEAIEELDWRGRLASGFKRDLSRIFRFSAEAVRLDEGGKRVNDGICCLVERVSVGSLVGGALLAMAAGDKEKWTSVPVVTK